MAKKDETPSEPAEASEASVIEAENLETPTAEAPVSKLQAVTDETPAAETPPKWLCPKDGSAMGPMGRRGRGGMWRCPDCGSIFVDTEVMRRGRGGRPLMWAPGPVWAPVVVSVGVSVLLTVIVRWLRSRPKS